MNVNEIKGEFEFDESLQCTTCLSVGRKLVPLGNYTDIFNKLMGCTYVSQSSDPKVCWECEWVLHKMLQFIQNAHKANALFLSGQNYIYGTLSNLTTVILNDNYPHTIYINETNIMIPTNVIKTEVTKTVTVDNDSDNCSTNSDVHVEVFTTEKENNDVKNNDENKKTKSSNRWAKKRALQNKKPKFKMLVNDNIDYDETFKKVQIKEEELRQRLEEDKCSEYFRSLKFKCNYCVMGFSNDDILKKHFVNRHSKKLQYACDICRSQFLSKMRLAAHVNQHYFKYLCSMCEFVTCGKHVIENHVRKCHRKVFQCLKCNIMIGNRRDFFKHFKEWHEKFICDYCGVSFKMRYCIKDHIRKQHSPFTCTPCNKRFARYNGLWLHNKIRHGAPTPPAYCVECDKRYVDIYRYRWHLANSAKHKPRKTVRIPCPGCDKVFSKNIYMKDHYNLVHLKYYKYRCEECDKNFIRNADLVKHKRRVHDGILPPKNKICYLCGRGFTTNKILTNHLRTHTGERPFACLRCEARFAQRAALLGHVRAVHDKGTAGK